MQPCLFLISTPLRLTAFVVAVIACSYAQPACAQYSMRGMRLSQDSRWPVAMTYGMHQPYTPSCHPARNGFAGANPAYSRPSAYATERRGVAHAEAFYEMRRIRQRYLDEQRERRLYTAVDVAELREHRDAVREMLEIKREMARERSGVTLLSAAPSVPKTNEHRILGCNEAAEISLACTAASPLDRDAKRCIWTSAKGHHEVEAELVRYALGAVTLRRDKDGIYVEVAFAALHPKSQRQVLAQLNWREWRDVSGTHSVVAKFVAYENGLVVLEKPDDMTIRVNVNQLSPTDQMYVTPLVVDEIDAWDDALPAEEFDPLQEGPGSPALEGKWCLLNGPPDDVAD